MWIIRGLYIDFTWIVCGLYVDYIFGLSTFGEGDAVYIGINMRIGAHYCTGRPTCLSGYLIFSTLICNWETG